jgi:hypothetical protein
MRGSGSPIACPSGNKNSKVLLMLSWGLFNCFKIFTANEGMNGSSNPTRTCVEDRHFNDCKKEEMKNEQNNQP